MMTQFQEDCINRCRAIELVEITFEEIKGNSETYFVSNFNFNGYSFTVYIYTDEAEFKVEENWYIFERPDYETEKQLADAFLQNLQQVLNGIIKKEFSA